jgi:L-tartrate/succinate antiporter
MPSADFWRLGAIFGLIFFVVFMVVTVPWLLVIG